MRFYDLTTGWLSYAGMSAPNTNTSKYYWLSLTGMMEKSNILSGSIYSGILAQFKPKQWLSLVRNMHMGQGESSSSACGGISFGTVQMNIKTLSVPNQHSVKVTPVIIDNNGKAFISANGTKVCSSIFRKRIGEIARKF